LTRLHRAFLLAHLFDYHPFFLHRQISLLTISRSLWPTGLLSGLNPSDHRQVLLIILLSPSIGRLHSVFHQLSLLTPFDPFFQKMVSTHALEVRSKWSFCSRICLISFE
jgi:hypothetical protein